MKGFAIVVALVVLSPSARAGSRCGSSADGGSSVRDHRSSDAESSSSSSSESTSNESTWMHVASSSGATDTPACVDDTDVVGYRRCRKFGTWSRNMRLPRVFLELGSNVRSFGSGIGTRTAQVSHGSEQFAFRTVMVPAEAAQDTAVTTAFRVGAGLGRGFYAGTELELGGLVSPAAATAEMMTSGTFGTPTVDQQRGLVLGALGVAGFRTHMRGVSLAVEGAGGVRSTRYQYQSAYHNCIETITFVDTRAVVEARARAELWLAPWVTAGATIGGSVMSRGDWMAGAYLGLHSRAFAGGR